MFDYIFFAIVGIPFVLALGVLVIEDRQRILDEQNGVPRTQGSYPRFTDVW
ncbi:MAG: hypothetical protein HIU92_11995 [Proteobacteria bacterium]|nr:hypothetical protein [Pseudomonadota bacterium]